MYRAAIRSACLRVLCWKPVFARSIAHDEFLRLRRLLQKKKNKLHGLVSGPGYVWVPLPVTETPMVGSVLRNGKEWDDAYCEENEGCQCKGELQLGTKCEPAES